MKVKLHVRDKEGELAAQFTLQKAATLSISPHSPKWVTPTYVLELNIFFELVCSPSRPEEMVLPNWRMGNDQPRLERRTQLNVALPRQLIPIGERSSRS